MNNPPPTIDVDFVPRMLGVSADDQRPQHVYICRNKDGVLLYVGVSLNAMERMAQHSHCSPWFKHVTHIEIERHPNRRVALDREKQLIQTLFPAYNTQHVDHVAAILYWFRQLTDEQKL